MSFPTVTDAYKGGLRDAFSVHLEDVRGEVGEPRALPRTSVICPECAQPRSDSRHR